MRKLKILTVIMIVLLSVSLVGCNPFQDNRYDDVRFHRSEHSIRDEIIEILDTQDEKRLKNLFSNDSLERIDNIDGKIKEYIDFYKGKSTEFKSISGSESGMSGNNFDHWYTIITDQGEFVIYFDYIAIDEKFEKDNKHDVSDTIGLKSLVILKQELADEIVYNPWPPEDDIFVLDSMDTWNAVNEVKIEQ